jgi:hypothetical protein
VADQHHGDAPVPHAPDVVEHALALDDAKGRRRLVHEDDPAGVRDCPRHGDGLALATGHGADRGGDVRQLDPEVRERGDGPAAHLGLVQHVQRRPPAVDLPAEVQVGRRVQVRGERQVLVHGLDAMRPGVERAAEAHRAALDEDLPRVGPDHPGQGLDQRALARAVVADQRYDLGGEGGEAGAVQGLHVAVALDHAACLKQRYGKSIRFRLLSHYAVTLRFIVGRLLNDTSSFNHGPEDH